MGTADIDQNSICQQRESISGVSTGTAQDYYFYSQLAAAQTPTQFTTCIVNALEKFGLDSFRFMPVGMEHPKHLSNWPAELLYAGHEHLAYDLLARHAETQTSPIYLSKIADYVERSPLHLESNIKFLALCKLTADHNLLDTYNIPYKTPLGINCLFSVSKAGMEPAAFRQCVDACRPLLYLLGDIIVNLVIARHASYFFGARAFGGGSGVTPKQVEILNILARDNVNLQGAAQRLHISLDTANKHIAAIKAVLGAKTQGAAVYRGVVAGLIHIDAQEWR